MYSIVGTKIETIVNSIKVASGIDVVYNYEPKQPSSFPYVSITPNSSNEVLFGSNSTLAEVPYNISVYVQYGSDQATQEALTRSIIDDILVALRNDIYLSGTAQKCIFEIERGYSNDQEVLRIGTIKATYFLLICD